jgi:hypothetical protein
MDDDMDELSYRNIWVSLAIILPIGAVGIFLLRHHDQARGVFEFVAMMCGILLLHVLDHREMQRNGMLERRRRQRRARG